ncbi:MAG: hypothetical protein R6V52_05290 [Bacteroidales bacterium]
MKSNISTYLFSFMAIMALASCYEVKEYPPEPEISYESLRLSDTTDALGNEILSGTLNVYFIDGDGDIGAEEPTDSASAEDSKNFFIDLLEKVDGAYEVKELAVPYEYRIPYFATTANNPSLKGYIKVSEIDFFPPFEGDTIKLRCYLLDRAGNKSNTVITPEVVLEDSLRSSE